MRVFLRVAAWVVLGWSTGQVLAGQRTPDRYEALRDGKLTFWVSSRRPFDGDGLVAELKKDYPKLQVQWQAFPPNALLPAIDTARQNGTLPDAVFADNAAQERPLMSSGRMREMAGRPRRGDRGWWMVLKDAPDGKVGEAFLVWLEQSPEWKAGLSATQLLTSADEAAVQAVAKGVMEAFGSFPVRPPQDALDTAVSTFAWNWVRLNQMREGGKQSYTSQIEKVGGNERLAYVLASTLEQGEDSFGVLHSFMVLRKEDGGWRVLLLVPEGPLPTIEQMFATIDSIGLKRDAPKGSSSVTLLAPGDGERVTRFPKTEIAFEQEGNPGELYGVESQYFDPGRKMWSPSLMYWVPAKDGARITRMEEPFGVGQQPHRWRVWSVNKAGVVTLSEWRTIDFIN
ncbi:hypothetical protein EDE15_2524 [Edaphobacter aggregans]|uniref:Uncharacterized protein n=1 Tax=Edaphobacter aggregans TaxID=570835 RepID=A0A3R9PSL3_9BACT|nr:hypothetical protein [Edaphobacter aggregans]RSL16996.1 hypothetical protein EDE15_2524 [Edaphobacter aggregans]